MSLTNLKENEKIRIEIRLENILDMGISFSSMLRVFEADTKEIFRKEIREFMKKISSLNSRDEFNTAHKKLCRFIEKTIRQKGRSKKASYGQIAKTINVALKVLVYYTHFPNPQQAEKVSEWLHAAVDNKMMKFLKTELKKDPLEDFNDWPKTIKEVDSEEKYQEVQVKVEKYIKREKKLGKHLYESPVHFDDIIWREIKHGRKGACSATK